MSEKPKLVTSTGPFKNIIILGHADVESFDQEAGKAGACLEEADYNVIYRDTLPDIHDKFSPILEEMSGATRGVNAKASAKAQERENAAAQKANREAKKKEVLESFIDFADRVKAGTDDEAWKAIDAKFREVALATPVNATPTTRAAGASKANLEKADEILTRDVDKIEAAVSKLIQLVPDYDLVRGDDGKPERLSLARLVGAYVEASKAGV